MYSIQKNVPVPNIIRGRKLKYPFPNMQIGDSFFVPTNEPKRVKNCINSCANTWGKRNSTIFKLVGEIKEDGVRFWRVK